MSGTGGVIHYQGSYYVLVIELSLTAVFKGGSFIPKKVKEGEQELYRINWYRKSIVPGLYGIISNFIEQISQVSSTRRFYHLILFLRCDFFFLNHSQRGYRMISTYSNKAPYDHLDNRCHFIKAGRQNSQGLTVVFKLMTDCSSIGGPKIVYLQYIDWSSCVDLTIRKYAIDHTNIREYSSSATIIKEEQNVVAINHHSTEIPSTRQYGKFQLITKDMRSQLCFYSYSFIFNMYNIRQ